MLEEKIEKLTAAVEALTAALQSAGLPSAGSPAPAKEETSAEENKAVRFVEDLQQPALSLVAEKGRDALVGVLAKFEARTVKDVAKKQWPALKAAIEEARAQ